MRAHWAYLLYVVRHKWFVLLAGLKTGAPLWRLLVHDWSKFTPAEWGPYVAHFYKPKPEVTYGDRRIWSGVSETERERILGERAAAFDRAWLHHQHVNPHHWQHWVLRQDDGDVKVLAMPASLVREMVADWMGAGRAITGKWGVASWYGTNRNKMLLHPDTRSLVETLLFACGNTRLTA